MSEKPKTPEEIFHYDPDDHYFRPKDEIRAIQKMLRGFGEDVKRESQKFRRTFKRCAGN